MQSLLDQIKSRRLSLGLKQHDLFERTGIARQQYQRLESKVNNPRLDTLELVAKGLKGELMLIPREKLDAVRTVLAEQNIQNRDSEGASDDEGYDPWEDIITGDP